eukprot:21241_1
MSDVDLCLSQLFHWDVFTDLFDNANQNENDLINQYLHIPPVEPDNEINTTDFLLCSFCNQPFISTNERNNHYNICESRKMKCPFVNCKWTGSFNIFKDHAHIAHNTSTSSQPRKSKENVYIFNHAIKFPQQAFANQDNSRCVWSRIIRFINGKQFLVFCRFKSGFITVFIRLIKLPMYNMDTINNSSNIKENRFGVYWIDFRFREKNESNGNKITINLDISKSTNKAARNLYGVSAQFYHEKK